jgi:hypothetical protein
MNNNNPFPNYPANLPQANNNNTLRMLNKELEERPATLEKLQEERNRPLNPTSKPWTGRVNLSPVQVKTYTPAEEKNAYKQQRKISAHINKEETAKKYEEATKAYNQSRKETHNLFLKIVNGNSRKSRKSRKNRKSRKSRKSRR